MGFLNPLIVIGTAGIAVPVIIHLLNRYRHREIDWGAMELLRRALVVRSQRLRLEDFLILLLRCLAVLLLALALARPTITGSGARWFGGRKQVGVVLAIDGSYSMAHEPGVNSRFDHAIKSLAEIRKTLSSGNPVSLVLMGNHPRTLLRGAAYDARRFDKELEKLQPQPEPLNLAVCLEKLASLVAETKAPARECYILTDAQKLTWQELPPKARAALTDISRKGNLFLLPTPADSAENLAVERFSLASGSLRKGALVRYVAEVRNLGLRPRENVPVRLFLGADEVPVDRRVIERIEPGGTAAVPLFARLRKSGDIKVTADIGRDALLLDNARRVVARVPDRVGILCVDGSPDPQKRPYRNDTDYLVAALTAEPAQASASLSVETIGHQELASTSLDDRDVVILANVADMRSGQVERLHSFVARGGTLVVFLGDNIVPRLVNARMRRDGAALLPAELLDATAASRPDSRGWAVEAAPVQHPLGGAVRLLPAPLLNEARVGRLFRMRLLPGANEILRLADSDLPLLAEGNLGRGRVLLFASTANRDWTNFIVHPIGPMLLHDTITYVVGRAEDRLFTVGEPLICPLPEQSVGTRVEFRSPDGKELPVQVTQRDGRTIAEYRGPTAADFYEIHYAEGQDPIVLATNVDAVESDVKTLQAEGLRTALAGIPAKMLFSGDDLAAAIKESRVGIELSLPLMIAGLVVLLAEAFLAYRFSRPIATAESLSGPRGKK